MEPKTHHVAFTVLNMDESVKWYTGKLGFHTINDYKAHDMRIVHIQLGEVRIELFDYGNRTQPLPPYRKTLMDDLHVVGTKHLCIEVANINETIHRLKEKGVTFVTELDTTGFGGQYIFISDCNGILIELYQQ